jgi:hypothetical protein
MHHTPIDAHTRAAKPAVTPERDDCLLQPYTHAKDVQHAHQYNHHAFFLPRQQHTEAQKLLQQGVHTTSA